MIVRRCGAYNRVKGDRPHVADRRAPVPAGQRASDLVEVCAQAPQLAALLDARR